MAGKRSKLQGLFYQQIKNMEQTTPEKPQVPPKKLAIRKKAGTYSLIALLLLVISLVMFYALDVQGGILWALVNLAFIVFLILAIIALIRGYSGK